MIQIKKFTFNPVAVNAYLLWDESGEAVVIDPACFYREEEAELEKFVDDNKLIVFRLLNTHGHFDHLMGNRFAESRWSIKCRIHSGDVFMMNQAGQHARLFGITMVNPQESRDLLMDGDVVSFGKSSLQVIHVPGHSPGSVAFFAPADKLLFAGDILFEGSVGRTDLPGGNHDLLISGIKSKLLVLDDDTRVFSGHGNETTIGWEKRTNPFLR